MIHNKIASYAVVVAFVALATVVGGAFSASAQTSQTTTMPALYNQAGIQVNNGNTTPLSAGYYFLAPGASTNTQVYYYGNGTYYNSTTGTYSGSVRDPNGTAGVTIFGGSGSSVAPGVPNTGMGGDALAVWMTLLASGLVVVAGAAYLYKNRVPFLR